MLRKTIQRIWPGLQGIIGWAKNADEVTELLEDYFVLEHSSKAEVERLLSKNRITFRADLPHASDQTEIEQQKQSGTTTKISIFLPGPMVWDGFLPFGSQYQIHFLFVDDTLHKIKASLLVNHF